MKTTDFGIFLHRSAYSSSSLLVSFYTQKNGLQKFIFRGGKKKAHNLFPLAVSELTYYGRNPELLNLTAVENTFPQTIQFDPIKSTIAFFMAETILKCVHVGDIDNSLYLFFENATKELEVEKELQLFPIKFLTRTSDALGFGPLIEDDNTNVFNLDAGVFQHTKSQTHRTFSGEAVDLIKQIIKGEKINTVPSKIVREDALKILLNDFSIHSPRFRGLDSYEILKEVLSS